MHTHVHNNLPVRQRRRSEQQRPARPVGGHQEEKVKNQRRIFFYWLGARARKGGRVQIVHNDRRSEQQQRYEEKRQVEAFAKINLSLDIVKRLPDGYHSIRTIMQQVGLYDTVNVCCVIGSECRTHTDDIPIEIALSGKEEYLREIPSDRRNIAAKAAEAFFGRFDCTDIDRVYIMIEKRIPPAAGLAGGSADAAAVLLGLGSLVSEQHYGGSAERFSERSAERNGSAEGDGAAEGNNVAEGNNAAKSAEYVFREIMELGSALGADVPFCIMGQACLNPSLGFRHVRLADFFDPYAPGSVDAPSSAGTPGEATSNNTGIKPYGEIDGAAFGYRTIGSCALGEGRGDILRPLPPLSGWVLLVKPLVAASTSLVYEGLNIDEITERPDTDEMVYALKTKNYSIIVKNMVNTLEIVALKVYPEIADLKREMIKWACADKVLMSGSGSTVFALYRDEDACRRGAEVLASRLTDCEIIPVALLS